MLTQNFLVGIVFYSLLYYLPIYYQLVCQMSLAASAALVLPVVLAQSIASIISGLYISWTGRYGEVLWLGYSCWALGAGLHLLFSESSSVVAIIFILIVEGCGIGFVFQPSECTAKASISQCANSYSSRRCSSAQQEGRQSRCDQRTKLHSLVRRLRRACSRIGHLFHNTLSLAPN